MRLPDFLAKPIFHIIYLINRRVEGATHPPIQRRVQPVSDKQRLAFDHLLDTALSNGNHTFIDYNLPYPKADFLNYICDWRGFVAHGSPMQELDTLEPLRKSKDKGEFGNRQQVFCSPDAMWAMWFAILDKDKFNLTRNGCVRVGSGARRLKYYHFELPKINRENSPFAEGVIYIARAEDFPDKRPFPLLETFNAEIEEWGATKPVTPLARIKVKPEDFPYFDRVQFNL
jgi:hypothetical protein